MKGVPGTSPPYSRKIYKSGTCFFMAFEYKIFVVGDVHGNFPKLKKRLDEFNFNPQKDKIIFVGDVMDRGYYNSRVATYIQSLNPDRTFVIAGNHEIQHKAMLPSYQILAKEPAIRKGMTVLFKTYKSEYSWPEQKKDVIPYQCGRDTRLQILEKPMSSFQDAVRYLITYTMAWEDDTIWMLIVNILNSMCGYPYNAERTLYDYFRVSEKTRTSMEKIWGSETYEIDINTRYKHFSHLVITHNNPFGKANSICQNTSIRDTLFVFGHIPNEKMIFFEQKEQNNGYLNLDMSPQDVGILCISKQITQKKEGHNNDRKNSSR